MRSYKGAFCKSLLSVVLQVADVELPAFTDRVYVGGKVSILHLEPGCFNSPSLTNSCTCLEGLGWWQRRKGAQFASCTGRTNLSLCLGCFCRVCFWAQLCPLSALRDIPTCTQHMCTKHAREHAQAAGKQAASKSTNEQASRQASKQASNHTITQTRSKQTKKQNKQERKQANN